MQFLNSDILSVSQFDRENISHLFVLAHRMRKIARREVRCQVLDGYILGSLFFEESTRTRMSSNAAFMRLGGQVNETVGVEFSSIAKGETLADTIRVAQLYCDILVIRHPQIGSAAEAARYSEKPVINAGDGIGEHPTQALLDLFTIFEERKAVDNTTVAMIGDLKHGRTVHSLARLLTLYQGIKFVFIALIKIQMPRELVDEICSKGFEVTETENFEEGIAAADVLYMTRIQEKRFEHKADFHEVNGLYVLTQQKVERSCKPGVVVMHPLPRITEIHTDVDDLSSAAYFRQAENGVLVRMALYLLVLGKEEKFV